MRRDRIEDKLLAGLADELSKSDATDYCVSETVRSVSDRMDTKSQQPANLAARRLEIEMELNNFAGAIEKSENPNFS